MTFPLRDTNASIHGPAADGTPDEARAYDERCAQIAREMLYVFSRVGSIDGKSDSR